MDSEHTKKFIRHCMRDKEGIVQYIATAHHNPVWARKRAISWIGESCDKNLIEYQGKALEVYSIKTITNYNAIKENEIDT